MILAAASTLEWDAERPGLHTHAEHGHDQHTDGDRSFTPRGNASQDAPRPLSDVT